MSIPKILGDRLINGLVFTVLVTLAWYGHVYHWALPDFARWRETPAVAAERPATQATSRSGASGVQATSPAPGSSPVAKAAATESLDEPIANPAEAVDTSSAEAASLQSVTLPSPQSAARLGIETVPVEQRTMDEIVTANGVVDYDQTRLAQLAVRVPGVVGRVEKRLGDAVMRGDVLAVIDAAEVGKAKAALLEAVVAHNLNSQTLERLEKMQSVIPERDLRDARAARELSRAQRFNAFQKLINLGFPLRLEDVRALSVEELALRLRQVGLPAELVDDSESANLIPLRAPFDGVITECGIVPGELVGPSAPQYVVADVRRVWVNLDLRQEDAEGVRVGAAVEFTTDTGIAPVVGRLTWIGTAIDPRTRTVRARVEVENPLLDTAAASATDVATERGAPESGTGHSGRGLAGRRALQIGAFGTARIVACRVPAALAVPAEAVSWQAQLGRDVVFVASADGQCFTPRPVTRGIAAAGRVQICAGLHQGEHVACAGCHMLAAELSNRLQKSALQTTADAETGATAD